jgi:hypothetical protein
MMSPAEMPVVQLVSVVSDDVEADVIVGGVDEVILFATVGGKLAKAAFQIFVTIDPLWSAICRARVMMQLKETSTSPLTPAVIAEPLPSITNSMFSFMLAAFPVNVVQFNPLPLV